MSEAESTFSHLTGGLQSRLNLFRRCKPSAELPHYVTKQLSDVWFREVVRTMASVGQSERAQADLIGPWLLTATLPGLSTTCFEAEKLASSPMDPHSQALRCASSQEIMGGCGFTPALLLGPVTCCKSLPWLVVHTVHARRSHSAVWLCWAGQLITLTKEPQTSAVVPLQKQPLQVLGLPLTQHGEPCKLYKTR